MNVEKRYDVFISHASEDKDTIARPLATELAARGFSVWYDEFSLRLGDSLNESINRGIAESRFGLVILSKNFFAKRWPTRELNGLTAMEVGGCEPLVLPIWHGVTYDDVLSYSPILADRKAVLTANGLEGIIEAVARRINVPVMQSLEEKLHDAEETVREFQCPHCGSPMVARNSVPLSNHDDGLLESFECGYTHIDGFTEHPCPSSSDFPKLSEYEFQYIEQPSEPTWKWNCIAIAKTKKARRLNLASGLGQTEEEAYRRVVDSYERFATRWQK